MPAALSPAAKVVAAELAALDTDERFVLLVPNQAQHDRALAIDHFDTVVGELRAHGWQIRTGTKPTANGLALWLAVAHPPKEKT